MSSVAMGQGLGISSNSTHVSSDLSISDFGLSSSSNILPDLSSVLDNNTFNQEESKDNFGYIFLNILAGFGLGSFAQGDTTGGLILLGADVLIYTHMILYSTWQSYINFVDSLYEDEITKFYWIFLSSLFVISKFTGGISLPINYEKDIDDYGARIGLMITNTIFPLTGLGCFLQGNITAGLVSLGLGGGGIAILLITKLFTGENPNYRTLIIPVGISFLLIYSYFIYSNVAVLIYQPDEDSTDGEDNLEITIIPNGFRIGF
jgi:hypothetical protein